MPPAQGATDPLLVPDLTAGARRILTTAADLFYRHGIHAVGVDRIAAESGVTKRTLYDRFGSKDALVATYLAARHQAWWAMLEQRMQAATGPKVLAFFDAYADESFSTDRGCAFLNASAELEAHDPARRVIQAHKAAVRARLGEVVRAELPDQDAVRTADHLFLLLEGSVAHRGIDGDERWAGVARRIAEEVVGSRV